MLTCLNPKHLALTALLLAVLSARGADAPTETQGAPATESAPKGAGSAVEAVASVSTVGINFSTPMQDSYAHGNWMVIEVDFGGKTPTVPPKWVDNVEVTLTLGWGKAVQGQPPQIDLAMTSSVHVMDIDPGKKNVVFFFVTPDTLTRGIKGVALDANRAPAFYVVQYSVAGLPGTPSKGDYSSTLLDKTWVEGFLRAATAKASPGLMSESSVPAYVLYSTLGRVGQNVFPVYVGSGTSDAGH